MSIRAMSHLDRIIEVLRILDPINPRDPIHAKTMATFASLSPQQAGTGLSRLHKTGYLAKVGTLDHYVLYIRTGKPLPHKSSLIERRYKRQLTKKSSTHHMPSPEEIARRVSDTVISALRQELRSRARSHKTGIVSRQLALFKNA
jgi:hypothetical protein